MLVPSPRVYCGAFDVHEEWFVTTIASDARLESLPLTPAQRYRGTLFLCLAVALVGFTMTVQMALNANFLADDIGVSGEQNGRIEAARESCGIFAFFLLALLAGIAEPLIGAVMLIFVAVGLGAYAYVPQNYLFVLGLSMIWSQGLHIWMPLPNSMALGLAEPGRAGRKLGLLAMAGAIGAFCGLAVAWGVVHWGELSVAAGASPEEQAAAARHAVRMTYIAAGVAAVLAAGMCLGIPRNVKTPGPRLVFRWRYRLYYLLCFLEGWRKQVFIAFSAFLLVKEYGVPIKHMLGLWLIVQVLVTASGQVVGRIIDRVGERKVLFTYYATMLVVFAGYAFAPNIWHDVAVRKIALYVLFVMDGSFFVLAMAMTTFVNRLVPPQEHTATLSAGVAANHVAAVSMPFIGGILWDLDKAHMWTFLIGAVAAIGSLLAVRYVPRRTAATSDK